MENAHVLCIDIELLLGHGWAAGSLACVVEPDPDPRPRACAVERRRVRVASGGARDVAAGPCAPLCPLGLERPRARQQRMATMTAVLTRNASSQCFVKFSNHA